MRSLSLWLTILAALAFAHTGWADSPPEPQIRSLRRAASGATAQQEVIRDALTRLQRADRLLGPAEASEGQTVGDIFAQRLHSGQPITPSALRELLETVDQHEKQAIGQLARQFRTQAYRTFRQRRGLFTRRRAAWSRVLKSWEDAGADFEQQDRLIDWLQLAIKSSTPGTAGPLPPEPSFGTVGVVAEAVVVQEPAEAIDWDGLAASFPEPSMTDDWGSRQSPAPAVAWPRPERSLSPPLSRPPQPNVDSPGAPTATKSVAAPTMPRRVAERLPELTRTDRVHLLPAAEGPRAAGQPSFDRTAQAVLPPKSAALQTLAAFAPPVEGGHYGAGPALGSLGQPESDTSLHQRGVSTVHHAAAQLRRSSSRGPQRTTVRPRSRPTPNAVGRPAMVATLKSTPLLTMDDPFREPLSPASLAGSVPGPAATVPGGGEAVSGWIGQLESVPDLRLAGRAARVDLPAVTSPRRIERPQSAIAERRSEHPPRGVGDLEATLLASLAYPSREMAPLANLATPPREVFPTDPRTAPTQFAEGVDASSGAVNIDELMARIAGNNLALRALEAALDDSRAWDARRLGPLVERLKGVVARDKDLMLIRDLLPQRQQSLIGGLESPQAAVAQLATRIFEARTRAAGSAFRGGSLRRRLELQTLDVLSRELAETATGG